VVDRNAPHRPHWLRTTSREVTCNICGRRGPYSIQSEVLCAPFPDAPYRLVVCGGRDYEFTDADRTLLDAIPIAVVISGNAKGADRCGELYAVSRGIRTERYPADWDKYGHQAGAKRNRLMAQKATAVAAFPGGSGTADMIKQAAIFKLTLFDFSRR